MPNDSLARVLKSLPHFRLLDSAALARIAGLAKTRRCEAMEALFFERDPARAFFAVQTGAVKLYKLRPDGREQVIHSLEPGATFAEAAVLNLGFYPVNAVTTESPTDLIEFPGDAFKELIRDDDRIAKAMIGSLSMRLLELVERVEELASASAAVRLARYLLKLPVTGPATRPLVELPVAKKDLAARLAIAPETLSRVLRKWEQSGLVDSAQRTLALLDPAKLLAIADGEASPD
jgi:CRP/FNR family transcriptional regulator, dissimilatory nitrate respiration regulator